MNSGNARFTEMVECALFLPVCTLVIRDLTLLVKQHPAYIIDPVVHPV